MSEWADDIKYAIDEEEDAWQELAIQAVHVGMLLHLAKKRVRKDRWGAWLKKNLSLSQKQAREKISWFTDIPEEDQTSWIADHKEQQAMLDGGEA
jgi:hypothetical protein